MTMEQAVQLIVQTGALGLLAYLILWGTRVGAPNLFASINGVKDAINANTDKLAALENKQTLQTNILLRLVELSPVNGQVREEAAKLRAEITKSNR